MNGTQHNTNAKGKAMSKQHDDTPSRPATFGEWNRQHLIDMDTPALVAKANGAAALKKQISARFAELFTGDEDETADLLVAEGFERARVEMSEAYEDAMNGDDAAELRRMYL